MSRLFRALSATLLLVAGALPAAASPGFSNAPLSERLEAARAIPTPQQVTMMGGNSEPSAPSVVLGFGLTLWAIDVSVAGDVDANGASDWIIGTPFYSVNELLPGNGRVSIVRRTQDGAELATKILDGPGELAYYGASVASVGDVDGDGYDDIAIGAPGVNGNEGRVYIHRGSQNGTLNAPAWTLQGTAGSFFGYRVAYAGDVNGDGFDDVLVSAPMASDGFAQQGAAYCFLGGGGGLASIPVRTWWGFAEFDHLGGGLAGGGDVNADGYTDVLVGSPGYTSPEVAEGIVRLYLGGPGGPSGTSAWSYETNGASDQVGFSIALPGDMNGDGYGEIAIGIPYANVVGTDDGFVVVFAGGPFLFALQQLYANGGGEDFQNYGHHIAPAGDQNGDGYADLTFGVPFTGPGNNDGFWFVVYGSPILDQFETSLVFAGPSGASAGIAVSGGGDHGNGRSDLLVGFYYPPPKTAPGSVADAALGTSVGPGFLVLPGITFHDVPYFAQREFAQGLNETGFGTSAVMMDINGDGYDDAIVGGSGYEDDISGQGVLRAYFGDEDGFGDAGLPFSRGGELGSPTGFNPWNAPDWTFVGGYEDANFAFSLANAGDVNGDGYEDLLVGAPTASADSLASGAAFLFLGGPDGPNTQPDWVSKGLSQFQFHGYSVAGAGDVNQDGYADVLIGTPLASNGNAGQAGRADLYYGSSIGLVHVPARTWRGTQNDENLGVAVAGTGDVDADGYPDVLISSPGYAGGQTMEGRIRIYRGGAAGTSVSPFFEWEPDVALAKIGFSAAAAGDVNGDGYADVLVGNPYWTNPLVEEGSVMVFHGGAGTMTLARTIEIEIAGAHLGQSVSTAGDLDGDGYSDIIIGAPSIPPPPPGAPAAVDAEPRRTTSHNLADRFTPAGPPAYDDGAVYIHFGASDGVELFSSYMFDYANTGGLRGELGRAVAGGGDLNGDGWPDILYTAPYADGLKVSDNGVISTGFSNVISDGLGKPRRLLRADGSTPIAHGGRSDSPTSFRIAGVGRHPMGRGRVRMQWQAKPPGALLDGTGIQTSASLRTGLPTAEFASSALFGGVATGLATGQAYRVRERFVTRHPFFPHSPWFTSARNGVLAPDLRTFGPTGTVAVGDEVSGVPAHLAFAAPWPNPLSGGTGATLSYALPAAGRVTIDAYDAQGRRVAHVHDADSPAGPSTVAWRGLDDSGRALPRGLYFLRLRAGNEEQTVKAVVAR